MKLSIDADRYLVGLYGLGLLRGWPFGDPNDAVSQMEAIRELLAAKHGANRLEIDDPGLDAAYAAWSKTYDAITNALIEVEEPVMRSILAGIEPARALDAASGTGRVAAMLAESGHDVIAIDTSAEMLVRARSKGIDATFIQGDLRRLPIADDSVDLLTCGLALTHVDDLLPAIEGFARVVRPGGRIVLSDVHPIAVATGGHALFHTADGSRGVARNEQHWPSSYVNAFVEAGLRIERCEEPLIDDDFSALLDPSLRGVVRASVVGLPFALIWLLSKG